MRKIQTYFEQLPVESVKKIAGVTTLKGDEIVVEPPYPKTEPYSVPADSLKRDF